VIESKNAEATLAGVAPVEAAGVETQRDHGTTAGRTSQPAVIPPFWMIGACRDAATDAILRATTLDDVAKAAWRYAVCTAMACKLTEASGRHPDYVPTVINTYSRQSPGRVRLAREYVRSMVAAADEAARIAIAQGVIA
jgi:hypothetical protein